MLTPVVQCDGFPLRLLRGVTCYTQFPELCCESISLSSTLLLCVSKSVIIRGNVGSILLIKPPQNNRLCMDFAIVLLGVNDM